MNIKAQIENEINKNVPMACEDIHAAMEEVNFEALHSAMGREERAAGYRVEDGVATIDVRGLLVSNMKIDMSDWGVTAYNNIIKYINDANEDATIEKIVLDVDSIGGTTTGVEAVAEAVANSEKSIEAFVSGNMYSAAYWLGAAADTITATAGSKLGSIGVIATHFDRSKSLEQRGITPTIIRSGEWKGAFSSIEPLTDKYKQRIAEDVNETASVFYQHVSKHRKMDAKTVRSWGGDTFNATQSKDIGLVDTISDKPTTTSQPTNLANAKGDDMNLQEALAENARLKAENEDKDKLLKAAADEKRDGMISALEGRIGREFTASEKEEMKAMDEKSFKFAASLVPEAKQEEEQQQQPPEQNAAATRPHFPADLFSSQATTGRVVHTGNGLDASFAAAKQRNLAK